MEFVSPIPVASGHGSDTRTPIDRKLMISVVVIVKNAEATISRCLDSIANQTYAPHEIIIVDGGSVDKTKEIVSRYKCKLISSTGVDTYGLARNRGVAKATGSVIAFLDADDYADQNWLFEINKALQSGDIQVATARREYRYPKNWFTQVKWIKKNNGSSSAPASLGPVSWNDFCTGSGVVAKSVMESIGGFDEDMFFGAEDKDLAFRLWRKGYQTVLIPRAVVFFRPASTAREWVKETFYRHGIGHGAMRKKYGVYKPPILIPAISLGLLAMATSLALGRNSEMILGALLVPVSLLVVKSISRYHAVSGSIGSVAYTILEFPARNLELLGFLIGYLVPPRILRRIWRR